MGTPVRHEVRGGRLRAGVWGVGQRGGSIRSGWHISTVWGVAHSWGMAATGAHQHSEREVWGMGRW